MGERQDRPCQLSLNRAWRMDFRGLRVSCGGGLILVRKLNERLGFSELVEPHLANDISTNQAYCVPNTGKLGDD